MKRAFTLIELLISVTIIAVVLGGGLIYFNNFNQRQKLERTEKQIVADLKLAQSYAKTRQVPMGFAAGDLAYVQVQFSAGNLVAGANGIGATFFSDKMPYNNEIGVGMSPAVIYYWAASGKISSDPGGNFLGENNRVRIQIQRDDSEVMYKEINIDALGQIELLGYQSGIGTFAELVVPTSVPTVAPTATSVPCVPEGSTCSLSAICCSGSCYSGVCSSCRPSGIECISDVDCCSNNCWGGFCADLVPTGVCSSPAESNPHFIESPPYSGTCVRVDACGYSDQYCL